MRIFSYAALVICLTGNSFSQPRYFAPSTLIDLYVIIILPLTFSAFPVPSIITSTLQLVTSYSDEESLSNYIPNPYVHIAASTPPVHLWRLGHISHSCVAFTWNPNARPPDIDYFEATTTFTFVATCTGAHRTSCNFIQGPQIFHLTSIVCDCFYSWQIFHLLDLIASVIVSCSALSNCHSLMGL